MIKRNRKYGPGLLALSWMLGLLALQVMPVYAADGLGNEAFTKAYNANPGLWGTPAQVLNETWFNTKSGQRQVQYFDKGRMELTYPETQPGLVGDSKLVVELVSGRMQVSDTLYWQYDAAEIPVAGGATFAANPQSPSYSAFKTATGADVSAVGKPVNLVLDPPEGEGFFLGIYSAQLDSALGSISKYAAYIPETGHNIADVFWSYLNQPGANGLPAFNWQTIFGLPITDSYWVKVRDGAKVLDILVQLYERRTLLYNPAGGQVESGNVGRDYYRWRYQLPELPVVDDKQTPPFSSANAKVTPTVGEGGTTFVLEASGFKPGETVDYYLRISPDGGVYQIDIPLIANAQGIVRRTRTTTPYSTDWTSQERYYYLTGRDSGVKALWYFKVIASTRYTPGAEAAQPSDVPEAKSAALDRKILRVGEVSKLFAIGFKPNEYLKGWVTTPLGRVVGWVGLVNSFSTLKSYPYLLRANKDGAFPMELPAPGVAVPGVYAFTLYGTESQNTAIVYFRVRSGPAAIFDPRWGTFDFDANPPRPAEAKQLDVLRLFEERKQQPQKATIEF